MTAGGLGYLRDPDKGPDEIPDFDARNLLRAAAVPTSASNQQHILSILNQGSMNSCVANAAMQAIRACHSLRGIAHPPLGSRLWAYYLSRAQHDATKRDDGTYIRMCMGAIAKLGFPPETIWPYATSTYKGLPRWARMPPANAFRVAHDQLAPLGYYRIKGFGDTRILEIKRAISQGHCVIFGTLIDSTFQDTVDMTPIDPPKGATVGGHAMVMAEYDEDGVGVVNSWGANWGAEGWCKFSWDYVTWDSTWDLWVVEHAPAFSGGAA